MTWDVIHADVLAALREMPDAHFDACFSDVPYGLGSRQPTPAELCAYIMGGSDLDVGGDFMGREWKIPSVAVWREIARVVKPGAPVLSFAGSRTSDLISLGIRAAGLELRDTQIHWHYATGFPKSLNLSKAIDAKNGDAREVVGINEDYLRRKPNGMKTDGATAYGYSRVDQPTDARITAPGSESSARWEGHGTALKPAYEPCLVAMKPLDGTFAENALKWGVAGLAIDSCRIGQEGGGTTCRFFPGPCEGHETDGKFAKTFHSTRTRDGEASAERRYTDSGSSDFAATPGPRGGDPMGRWPANVSFSEEAAAQLDLQSGNRPGMSGGGAHRADYAGGMFGAIDATHVSRNDEGGASRFFFCAKASRFERDFGCEDLHQRSAADTVGREDGAAALDSPRTGAGRTSGARNHHPCVKPLALTQYLAGLALPPPRSDEAPRRLLIPYAGSGSEMIGALRAGWEDVVGIELDAEYLPILRARIERWLSVPSDTAVKEALRLAKAKQSRSRNTPPSL